MKGVDNKVHKTPEVNEFIQSAVINHSQIIAKVAFSYLNNIADAEDIVQEVFLILMQKQPKLENEEHLKAWLIRVAINEKTLKYLSSYENKTQSRKDSKIKTRRLYASFGAIACVLAFIIIPMFNNSSDFKLPNSTGNVSVKYIEKAPSISWSSLLESLTEEELSHKYNTDIFMGKIEDIRNIEIDFNGWIEYRAIAKIRIDKMYRGDRKVGETVSIILPSSVDTNIWVEDTEVSSSMRVGMTGIFMPIKNDKNSYREENEAKIYYIDIAEYNLLDGERYSFLDSDNGLIFNKTA